MRFIPSPYSDGYGGISDIEIDPDNLEAWASFLTSATGTGFTIGERIRRAKARRKAKKDKEGKRKKRKKGGKKVASTAPLMTLPDFPPLPPPEEEEKEFPTGLVIGLGAIVLVGVFFIASQKPSAKGGK
jgi:hypothetical protein